MIYHPYLVRIWLTPRTATAALRSLWTCECGVYGTAKRSITCALWVGHYLERSTPGARICAGKKAARARARIHTHTNFPNAKSIQLGEGGLTYSLSLKNRAMNSRLFLTNSYY
jgi:hypothetical protein